MLKELQAVKKIVKALRNKKWKRYCRNRFSKINGNLKTIKDIVKTHFVAGEDRIIDNVFVTE